MLRHDIEPLKHMKRESLQKFKDVLASPSLDPDLIRSLFEDLKSMGHVSRDVFSIELMIEDQRAPVFILSHLRANKTATPSLICTFLADFIKDNPNPRIQQNPLHLLCEQGYAEGVAWILNQDPTLLDALDSNQYSPLHHAVKENNTLVASFLLDRGADSKMLHLKEWGPLHHAAYHGNRELIEMLVSHGCPIDRSDVCGFTALHVASANGELDSFMCLMTLGANAKLKNTEQKTAIDIAFEEDEQPILQFFKSFSTAKAEQALLHQVTHPSNSGQPLNQMPPPMKRL